jgi:phosphotransferase system  glucose/maltose/N-acetylglucosamine-specific IIC component
MFVWIFFAFVLIINALFGGMLPHGIDVFIYIGLCVAMLGYAVFYFYKRDKHSKDPLQEIDEVNRIMSEEEKLFDKSDHGE